MNLKLSIFVALFAVVGLAAGHKYKSGECPQVEPMQGFDMKKVSHFRTFQKAIKCRKFNLKMSHHAVTMST
jgi:hypothetical protein